MYLVSKGYSAVAHESPYTGNSARNGRNRRDRRRADLKLMVLYCTQGIKGGRRKEEGQGRGNERTPFAGGKG